MLRKLNFLQAGALFLLIGAFVSCNKDPEYTTVSSKNTAVYDFWLEKTTSNPSLNRPYQGMIVGDTAIRLLVDYGTNITALEPTIFADADSIKPTGKQNFTNPVTYTIWAKGKTATYTVRINVSTVQNPTIKSIVTGYSHVLALKTDGTLWVCGDNASGQLGLGDYSTRNKLTQAPVYDVAQIFTGDVASIIKLKDGTAWGTGNRYGELGLGNKNSTPVFVRTPFLDDAVQLAITFYEVFCLKPDGTVWGAGRNYTRLLAQGDADLRASFVKIPVSNVQQLSTNSSDIVIRKANGEVWGWGDNLAGELGLGDKTRRTTPVQLRTVSAGVAKVFTGGSTTFLIDNNGKVWGAGANLRGQLAIGDVINRDTFALVPFFSTKTIDAIIPHSGNTSFKESNGAIWNVGDNVNGLMGLGTVGIPAVTTPAQLPGFTAATVAGNGGTAFALKADGTLWGWGSNLSGALGTGLDTAYMSSPVQLK